MFKVVYGMDTVVAAFDNIGDAATELMARGRGYSIIHGDEEITYEDLMMDK